MGIKVMLVKFSWKKLQNRICILNRNDDKNADEFYALINSNASDEYREVGKVQVSVDMWWQIINNYPDINVWGARKNTW